MPVPRRSRDARGGGVDRRRGRTDGAAAPSAPGRGRARRPPRRAVRARRAPRSRRAARGGLAQHQPGLDRAVVAVDLEPDRGVDGLARARRAAGCPRRSATQRERAPPARERERDVAALPPSPRGSESCAPGTSSATRRVALPERRERARAPRPAPSVERVARRDGVDAHLRHEVLGREHAAAWAANASRNAVDARRARSSGPRRRGGRRSAAGARRAACRPPSRSKPGIERPEPVPSSPSSAISTAGRWWRSAIRAATIPITPGMPALAGEHVRAARSPSSATSASASKRIRVSTSRRSALTRVELGGDRARALAVLGQQQLEPGVGAVQPPGGVDPRREPEADRAGVERARVDAGDGHQRAQPGLARSRRARAGPRGRGGGSRRAAARRRRRSRARRGRGPRRPAPDPRPRPRAAPARACARRAAAHRSGHG